MPDSATPVGSLYVIGGAEDKLEKRTVLSRFVKACGGGSARIAIVPTASSLGPEIIDVYAALFTRLGAAEVFGVRPETREAAADPAYVRPAGRGDRDLHDRRQPAQAVGHHQRHPVRRGDQGRSRAWRDGGRHVGRGQHPVLAHGRVRQRRHHPEAADDPDGRRPRPGRRVRDRPALRAAQPLRAPPDGRRAVAQPARHRHRRGHRGGDHDRVASSTSSAAERSRSSTGCTSPRTHIRRRAPSR